MRSRCRPLLADARLPLLLTALSVVLALFPSATAADGTIGQRWELTGLGGGGFGGSFDLPDGDVELDAGYGGSAQIAFRPNPGEGGLVFIRYAYDQTPFLVDLDERPPGAFDVAVSHIQLGGEADGRVFDFFHPFLGLSIGASHYSPVSRGLQSSWFFSTGLYSGFKIPVGDHWGFRLEGGLLATIMGSDANVVCVPGACLTTGSGVIGPVRGHASAGLFVAF